MVCKAFDRCDILVGMRSSGLFGAVRGSPRRGKKEGLCARRRAADTHRRSTDRYPQALLFLGRAYHALGEFSRAAQALNFYLRGKPDSIAGRFFLGRVYIALEAYPEAFRHLKRVGGRGARLLPCLRPPGAGLPEVASTGQGDLVVRKGPGDRSAEQAAPVGYLNTALVLAIRLFHRGDLDRRGAAVHRGPRAETGEHPSPSLPRLDLPGAGQGEHGAVPPGCRLADLAAGPVPAPAEGRRAPGQGQKPEAAAEIRSRDPAAQYRRRRPRAPPRISFASSRSTSSRRSAIGKRSSTARSSCGNPTTIRRCTPWWPKPTATSGSC